MGVVRGVRAQAVFGCSVVVAVVVACGGTVGADHVEGGATPDGGPSGVGVGVAGNPDPDGAATSGVDAAAADAADASPQGDGSTPDATLPDDPCPPKLDVNCSTSCGGPAECFKVSSCSPGSSIPVPDDQFPFVVRTPSSPGSLTDAFRCFKFCTGAATSLYALSFKITTLQPQVRVRVEPPWRVANRPSTNDACTTLKRSCESMTHITGGSAIPIVVGTDDPNAPARNVIIEATSDECPP